MHGFAVHNATEGIVLGFHAGEILPDLKHAWSPRPVLVGGTDGVALMLLVREVERRVKGPVGLLFTVALSLEVLILGLTLALGLGAAGTGGAAVSSARAVGLTAALVRPVPAGALLAAPAATLPAPVVTGFFVFGLIALLYLVTKELLIEPHDVPDRP